MITEQLRKALDEQITEFQKYYGPCSVDQIAFDTDNGVDCLRVGIGTSRQGASVNHGYSHEQQGYASREELRFGVIQVLAEHGFKYKQPERKSLVEKLIPALID